MLLIFQNLKEHSLSLGNASVCCQNDCNPYRTLPATILLYYRSNCNLYSTRPATKIVIPGKLDGLTGSEFQLCFHRVHPCSVCPPSLTETAKCFSSYYCPGIGIDYLDYWNRIHPLFPNCTLAVCAPQASQKLRSVFPLTTFQMNSIKPQKDAQKCPLLTTELINFNAIDLKSTQGC